MEPLKGFIGVYIGVYRVEGLGSKKWNAPNMNPLLHWGNKEMIWGFQFLDPLEGVGKDPLS